MARGDRRRSATGPAKGRRGRGLRKATRKQSGTSGSGRARALISGVIGAITRPVARIVSSIVSAAVGWASGLLHRVYDNTFHVTVPPHSSFPTDSITNEGATQTIAPTRPTRPTVLDLPFDVLGFDVLPFLTCKELDETRLCCRAALALVDRYAEICTLQSVSFGENRLMVGMRPDARITYKPSGERYNKYLLYRFIRRFGSALLSQREVVDAQYLSRMQGVDTQGFTHYIDAHMRVCLIDWIQEAAAEYLYPYSVWQAAVIRIDAYLSKRTTRRRMLQLVGCVCLLLEAIGTATTQVLTPAEAVRLCDNQYTEQEVRDMMGEVVSETAELLPLVPGGGWGGTVSIADSVLCLFLGIATPASRVVHMAVRYADSFHEAGDSNDEHLVMLLLLSDLAPLDYEMLKCTPFTIAMAIICYASVVMHHFSQGNIVIGSYGHVLTSSARTRRGPAGPQKPYVTANRDYISNPFGSKLIHNYVMSMPFKERLAISYCLRRIWKLHCDFLWHTYYTGDTAHPSRNGGVRIVRYHLNVFKGLVQKFANVHSCRHRVWRKLGPIAKKLVEQTIVTVMLLDHSFLENFEELLTFTAMLREIKNDDENDASSSTSELVEDDGGENGSAGGGDIVGEAGEGDMIAEDVIAEEAPEL